MTNYKKLTIRTTQGEAGTLHRESQVIFNYSPAALGEQEISLTMPLSAKSYAGNILPGVLRQNLPEGYLLEFFRNKFGKIMKMDDFNLFALTGRETIGRVRCEMIETNSNLNQGERLSDLLTWQGTEDLFHYLAEKYAVSSGISGVQPKVVLRERRDENKNVIEKTSMKDRGLIIKAAGDEYSGLAENEYICMSIARKAGLITPDFWLSDNKELFITERFDLTESGYLGFEDMTALTGKQNDAKYDGSYEMTAKVVKHFVTPRYINESLIELFKSIVLSVVVRNGDAHLKNFGLLYTTPQSEDVRLSPLYDIVNTTVYIPKDVLALKMAKTKSWPDRKTLVEFGREHCHIDRPEDIIDHTIDSAMTYLPDFEPGDIWDSIKTEIERGARSLLHGDHRQLFIRSVTPSKENLAQTTESPAKTSNRYSDPTP